MPAPSPRINIGDSYLSLFDPEINSKFILCEGPRGTGKTRGILCSIVAKALHHPGSRWLLARSSRVRLSQSVLTTLEQQVFPAFGLPIPGLAGAVNRTSYDLPNGSKLIPMGLDDQQRTQSVECAGIYVAEGTELTQRNDVLALAGAMRQDVPGLVHQCIVDCNPGPPGHWLNKAAEPIASSLRRVMTLADYERLLEHNRRPAQSGFWKRIVTKIQDNPAYFDVIGWAETNLGRSYMQTLGYLSGFLKRRWIDGDWTMAEGAVFPEFNESHIVTPFPITIPDYWPGILSCDPGYAHVAAFAKACVAPNGRIYFVGERVKSGCTIPEHAAWMTEQDKLANPIIRKKLGDPHDMFKHTLDGNGKSKADQFAVFGHKFEPAPIAVNNAQLSAQVEQIRTGLVTLLGDGQPRIQFTEDCPMLISAMQSWEYKRNTHGVLMGDEDQYAEAYKDECDAIRMVVAANLKFVEPLGSVSRR